MNRSLNSPRDTKKGYNTASISNIPARRTTERNGENTPESLAYSNPTYAESNLANFYEVRKYINDWGNPQSRLPNLSELNKIGIDLNDQMVSLNSIMDKESRLENIYTMDALTNGINSKLNTHPLEYPGPMINDFKQPYYTNESNNIGLSNVNRHNALPQNQASNDLGFEQFLNLNKSNLKLIPNQEINTSTNKDNEIIMNHEALDGSKISSLMKSGQGLDPWYPSSHPSYHSTPSVKPTKFSAEVFSCGTTWTREYDLNGKKYLSKTFTTEKEYQCYIHSFNAANETLGNDNFVWVMERGRKLSTAKSRSTQRIVFKDCFNCFYGRNYFKVMKKLPKNAHPPKVDANGERILCSSTLVALGLPNGEVRLKYFDNHVGHTVKDDKGARYDDFTKLLSDGNEYQFVKNPFKTLSTETNNSIESNLVKNYTTKKRKYSDKKEVNESLDQVNEEDNVLATAKKKKNG